MSDCEEAFRKSLTMVASAILKTQGFENVDKMAMETLLEVLQSCKSSD